MPDLRSKVCYAGHDLQELSPPAAGLMRCPCCVDRELWKAGIGEYRGWWFPANGRDEEEAERTAPGWSRVDTDTPGGRPPGWVDPEYADYLEREAAAVKRIEAARRAA